MADSSDVEEPSIRTLQDELLEIVALLDPQSAVRLAMACSRFRRVVESTRPLRRLELLHVTHRLDACGNRVFFQRRSRVYMHPSAQKPCIKSGASTARVVEAALLLRRHARLTVIIEGHEAVEEGVSHQTGAGDELRVSFGSSLARAEAGRDALCELECLQSISSGRLGGARVWGSLPKARFAPRIQCRGWEDAVVEAAGWAGADTCQAELFFTLDGVELPQRGSHYEDAADEFERSVGWRRHFASLDVSQDT